MTRKRWKNPDKRMALAVELRSKGWSLRQIGTELNVSEGTIRNDLARHEREKSTGDALVIPLRNQCAIPQRNHAPDCAVLRSEVAQAETTEATTQGEAG